MGGSCRYIQWSVSTGRKCSLLNSTRICNYVSMQDEQSVPAIALNIQISSPAISRTKPNVTFVHTSTYLGTGNKVSSSISPCRFKHRSNGNGTSLMCRMFLHSDEYFHPSCHQHEYMLTESPTTCMHPCGRVTLGGFLPYP